MLSLEAIGIKGTKVNYIKVDVMEKLKRKMVDTKYISIVVTDHPIISSWV